MCGLGVIYVQCVLVCIGECGEIGLNRLSVHGVYLSRGWCICVLCVVYPLCIHGVNLCYTCLCVVFVFDIVWCVYGACLVCVMCICCVFYVG